MDGFPEHVDQHYYGKSAEILFQRYIDTKICKSLFKSMTFILKINFIYIINKLNQRFETLFKVKLN